MNKAVVIKGQFSEIAGVVACFAAGIYPFLPIIKEWSLAAGTAIELFLVLSLTVLVFVRLASERFSSTIIASFLLLLLLLTVYCILGEDGAGALSGFRALALPPLAYLALYGGHVGSSKGIDLAAKATVAAALLMSIGCIVQLVYPEAIRQLHNPENWSALRNKTDWIPFSQYNRAMSFMNDPNVLSVFLCIALFMWFEITKSKKEVRKRDHISSGLLLGIVLTGSRTGLVLVGSYLLLRWAAVLLRIRFHPKRVVAVSVFLLLGIILIATMFDQIVAYLRVDSLATGNGRFAQNSFHYEVLTEEAAGFLFGHGLFDGRLITFENSYLLLFYTFGLIGLTVGCTLILALFQPLLSRDNVVPLICTSAAFFVGDYVLIPQISLYIVLWLLLGRRLSFANSQTDKGVSF